MWRVEKVVGCCHVASLRAKGGGRSIALSFGCILHSVFAFLPKVALPQFLKSSFPANPFGRKVVIVGRWFGTCQVVKLWAAAGVKAVGKVFQKFCTGRAKVGLKVDHGLCAVFDILAHCTTKIAGDLCH